MHSVTTEQNNSHYNFQFFKRPRWIIIKKIGARSFFLKCASKIFWVCLEKNMKFQIKICMGPNQLLIKFCFILVGDFFMTRNFTVVWFECST